MAGRFTRTIENFNCGHCGAAVTGNGYTNHCPQCLWSRHVDEQPGDRAASCGGLMEPVKATQDHGRVMLTHQCTECPHQRRNQTASEDNFEVVLEVMRRFG